MASFQQPKYFPQEPEDFFGLITAFGGYVSKPEVTNITPNFLVPGSKNVMIDYANRVISRPGYTLYRQANNGGPGVAGSYEWETSTGSQFSLRSYGTQLEFDWNGSYNTLLSNLVSPYVEFTKVLDFIEQIDVLLFVLGDGNLRRWSGGVSKVRSSTVTTLTKQGVLGPQVAATFSGVTITIASPAVITSTAHGLTAGTPIRFYTTEQLPDGITEGQIYYVIAAGLTTDAFEISATLAGAAVNTSGSQSGIQSAQSLTVTNAQGISFTASPSYGTVAATITDANNNFLNAGFAAGDTLNVTGSILNSRQFTIGSVTASTITLIMTDILFTEAAGQNITIYNQTGPTWKSARFLSIFDERSIIYKGIQYGYTGGENSDTLTGLSAFPTVTAGDAVWQAVDTFPLSPAITGPYPNFFPNLIGTQLNMVFLGSTSSSIVFSSSASDYTDFTLTTPRAQGDPIQQPLTSGPMTCIVPIDSDADVLNVINTLIFGSGQDAFDQLDFHMSNDNTQELVRTIRYKTAPLSGLISKDAICPIKDNTVYISHEPALVGLSEAELEGADGRNAPISDPIKNDFDSYNFTGAHIKYWKRAIFIALPSEGLILIYDLMRNLWQPPQTMPIARLGIVNGQLIGHSAVNNETYQLFIGTNDNGNRINFTARFAYNNGGRRDRLKNQSECWSDGYISPNGLLNMTLGIGFEASIKKWTFPISGLDPAIITGKTATPLGNAPFGSQPLGGANTSSPHGTGAGLYRFEQIDTVQQDDYFEQYTQYDMNTLDGQFAIVAFGSDQYDAGTSPNTHKK